MNIAINIIGAAFLGLCAFFILRLRSHVKNINAYFRNAVRVYALTDEEDARIAIVTVAKAAAKKQRYAMVKYLQSISADLKKMSEDQNKSNPNIDKFIQSSMALEEELLSKKWTTDDIENQKKILGDINPEYLAALDKADPTIFVRKHPELFK